MAEVNESTFEVMSAIEAGLGDEIINEMKRISLPVFKRMQDIIGKQLASGEISFGGEEGALILDATRTVRARHHLKAMAKEKGPLEMVADFRAKAKERDAIMTSILDRFTDDEVWECIFGVMNGD